MRPSWVTQRKEDRVKGTDGGHSSEQDRSGTERLAAGDIEARSGGSGDSGLDGLLLHGYAILERSGGDRVKEGPVRLAATDSLDGLPKFRVS